jgi:hypothetical protein
MKITHVANPVRVRARVVFETIASDDGNTLLKLDDGTEYIAGPEMTARHTPVTGDYLVEQLDGYIYINPKDVFERKYAAVLVETEAT